MFAAEAVMYGTAVCYGHVNQYPISTWGENLFILLQGNDDDDDYDRR